MQAESVRVKTITASGDKIFFIGLLGVKEILSKWDYSDLVLKEVVTDGLVHAVVDGKIDALGHDNMLVFVVRLELHVHVATFAMPRPVALNVKQLA